MAGVPGLALLAVGNGDEEVIVIVHNQRQSPMAITVLSCLSVFVPVALVAV